MVAESVTNALSDAKLNYTHIQQAVVGYVDGKLLQRLTVYILMLIFFLKNLKVNLVVASELSTHWEWQEYQFTMSITTVQLALLL